MKPATKLQDNKCMPNNPMIILQLTVTFLPNSQSTKPSFPTVTTPNSPHIHEGPTTHDLIQPLCFLFHFPGCSRMSARGAAALSQQPQESSLVAAERSSTEAVVCSPAVTCKCLVAQVQGMIPCAFHFYLHIRNKKKFPNAAFRISTRAASDVRELGTYICWSRVLCESQLGQVLVCIEL